LAGKLNLGLQHKLFVRIAHNILFVSAAIIFTTYFEDLVVLNSDKGYFITDNESMRKFVASAIKISLNGVSLTVISFTIVFLFHGVGGK
jgi:hypothetical protein